MKRRLSLPTALLLWIAVSTRAEISVAVDKLDSTDGFPLPVPHLIVVDVSVDPSSQAPNRPKASGMTTIAAA